MRIAFLAAPLHAELLDAYLQRRGDLVRAFAGRLGSQARAEDIVQAMYERIASVSSDEPIDNPLAYLYRLGSNLILDDLRQHRRSVARDKAWSDLQGAEVGGVRVADTPYPESAIDAREALRRLLAVVQTLPPQAQRAFTLHKLNGLSHAETAQAMGVSRSAVEKHMSLALRLVVQKMAKR